MSTVEYVTTKFPDGAVEKILDRPDTVARIKDFTDVHVGTDRFRTKWIGSRETRFGQWREHQDGVERIKRVTAAMGIGPKLIIQRESDLEMLSCRQVTEKLHIPELHADPDIERLHALIWAQFSGQVRSGGLWLCRYVLNTHSVSTHGYKTLEWQGAAEDVFVTEGGMPRLVEVAEFSVEQALSGSIDLAVSIVDNRIWTPGQGRTFPDWPYYSGARHYHNHNNTPHGSPCTP